MGPRYQLVFFKKYDRSTIWQARSLVSGGNLSLIGTCIHCDQVLYDAQPRTLAEPADDLED